MYDALLLDHDGVIVDLLALDSLESGILSHGKPCYRALGIEPDDSLRDALSIGAIASDIQQLASSHGVDASELWRCRDDAAEQTLQEATRTGEKDPYDDVSVLESVELPVGVASNNQRRIVEFILAHHDLTHLFETVWGREPTIESLGRKKPEPTYLLGAMEDMSVENPLYVGDSETDVIAANRAAVDCAFIRRSHNAETPLSVDPAYEVTGLDQVVAILGGTRVPQKRTECGYDRSERSKRTPQK